MASWLFQKKYQVQGGSKLISEWYKKWDGTESSLRKQSGGDVRSILTPKEKKLHIRNFVTKKSKVEAAIYPEVKKNVEKKTGKDISLRSVQEIGQAMRISSKSEKECFKAKDRQILFSCFSRYRESKEFFFLWIGTEEYRESVIRIRKKCQNVNKNRLVFIDGRYSIGASTTTRFGTSWSNAKLDNRQK